MKDKSKRRVLHRLHRMSLKILIRWIRFSKRHQHSHRLPIFLFVFLVLDGFVVVIPSILLVIASITISPRRWILFGCIFTFAVTLNNVAAYYIGFLFSPDTIVSIVEKFHMTELWHSAERALHDYGSYAAFFGAIIGLPTQMVMALIGLADAQMKMGDQFTSSFGSAIVCAFLGHAVKGMSIAFLTRYGWVKLEKRINA